MMNPLVTVICLSYNHESFIAEAIQSVLNQTYKNIEIIIVDDASTDQTVHRIEEIISSHPAIRFLPLEQNLGNCKAFNRGLAIATGDYIIDFATDDVLMADKISEQVSHFSKLDESFGVVFSDAVYINSRGKIIRNHFEHLRNKNLIDKIPEGDIYKDVLLKYFIPSPTMMIKRKIFEALNGYDENLSYEDFDFWVRSSRLYKYSYLDKVTTKIRLTDQSMSRSMYKKGDKQLFSTFQILKKAKILNQTSEENNALAKRLRYEIRQSVFSENNHEAKLFYQLLMEVGHRSILTDLLMVVNAVKLPLTGFRNFYQKIRYDA